MEAQPPGRGAREWQGRRGVRVPEGRRPQLRSRGRPDTPVCTRRASGVRGDGTRTRARAHGQRGKEPRPRAGTAPRVPTPRPARLPFCSAAAISRGPGAGEALGARPRGSRWAWPVMGVAGGGRGPGPLCSPPGGREAPRARPPARPRRSSV
ncbi:uncharacterized protein LOC110323785 [Mus pahari]|uniref:uncharacterized protein LOC110323785 n=1 Tax=Mus pahari TaxID=10093 RepID=UPI000A30AE84|nr:uncharacterized protein LOC110323785 [Mus pahari]